MSDNGTEQIKMVCIRCGEEKLLSEFYPRRDRVLKGNYQRKIRKHSNGHRTICKVCDRKRVNSSYHKLSYEEQRRRNILYKYKLSIEEYNNMLQSQGGGCAICGGEVNGKGGVDHCHRTNKIRGVLCCHCNAAIGHMNDDKERLAKAIKYIERWE
jgi:hypothetical protein